MIYYPVTNETVTVPTDSDDGNITFGEALFVNNNSIWAVNNWSIKKRESLNLLPALSKFNRNTNKFEIVSETTLKTQQDFDFSYSELVKIQHDKNGNIWIFVSEDGIYKYSPVNMTIKKELSLPNMFFDGFGF